MKYVNLILIFDFNDLGFHGILSQVYFIEKRVRKLSTTVNTGYRKSDRSYSKNVKLKKKKRS